MIIYILIAIIIPIVLMSIVAYWYGKKMFKEGFGVGVAMGFRWVQTFADRDATNIYISHCEKFPDDAINLLEPTKGGRLIKMTPKKLTFYEK